jgi:predicted Zn finger-like uncharacterized protein
MVIECPSCHACFRVDAAKIPPGGRSVRCGRCANTFHADAAPPVAPQTLETIGCARAIPRDVVVPIAAAMGIQAAGAEARATMPTPLVSSTPSEPEIRLSRPPQVAAADAAVPETAPVGEPTWWLTREGGDEATVDRAAMRELIRQGEVLPSTPLRVTAGADPVPAGEVPELQRYFRLRPGGSVREAIAGGCVVHPTTPAEHHCPTCLSIFCGVCVGMKQFGTRRIVWCRRCDDRCIPYEGTQSVVPFWRRIPELVRYPLAGWGPFMIACCAFLAFFGAFLPGPGKALYFIVLAYQLHILKESSEGKPNLPDWPEMTDLSEITARGMKALLVTAIAWLPVIAFNYVTFTHGIAMPPEETEAARPASYVAEAAEEKAPTAGAPAKESQDGAVAVDQFVDASGQFDFEKYQAAKERTADGDGPAGPIRVDGLSRLTKIGAGFLLGNAALILIVGLYYPMCLMIAAIFNTIAPALNPAMIVRCIGRIKADYAMALVFCGLLMAAGVAAKIALSIIPVGGAILSALFASYLMFIQMHILGWTAHQGRERLNWDIKI